jgi:hypothetical protein
MGRACDPYGEEYSCIQGFRETDHLEHLCVDRGRGVILKWIFKKKDVGVGWICPSLHRGKWRALLNAVMNLQILYNMGQGRGNLTRRRTISFSWTLIDTVPNPGS